MPTQRLSGLFARLAKKRQQIGSLFSSQPFFDQAIVQQVKETGRIVVLGSNGRAVDAFPTTDEVFVVGQNVWISRTESGAVIIHGGVR